LRKQQHALGCPLAQHLLLLLLLLLVLLLQQATVHWQLLLVA
jgi:hypothetical protein